MKNILAFNQHAGMSMSKEETLANAEQPRRPKCTRCRHHGIIVPQKGHVKYCPFLKCDCWKCYLITQRTQITAIQRQLKRAQNKTQNTQPAAAGTSTTSDLGARPSATFVLTCPPSDAAPERGATFARSPLDLRSRASREAESAAGGDGGKALPIASSEEAPCTPFNGPYFSEFGQTAPLPFIHFPVGMSGHYPSSFTPCPNPLINVPWFPPVPAGLYSDGLPGPLMFPHFRPHAVHYPPPPEPAPPADRRPVFFTLQTSPALLPEPFQEELMYRQHQPPPPSKQTEKDIEKLD